MTLVESNSHCGGQAFSIPIDKERFGSSWLNQGVQGGSPAFRHTMAMFKHQGFNTHNVELQVSFGKDEHFWSNVFPTKLLERHAREVRRFHYVLRFVRWTELLWLLYPLHLMLWLFMFSSEFINDVALPMVALFLGTGNATPQVPAIILERLVTSPKIGMWYPGDKDSLISNLPQMIVFPELGKFYDTWRRDLVKRGVHLRLSTSLQSVRKRDRTGVTVAIQGPDENSSPGEAQTEFYDEIVLCVLADAAKQILGPCASWREHMVLKRVTFSDDITVTHNDTEYMKKYYENFYNEKQAVEVLNGTSQKSRLEWARANFRPMYYIKEYLDDRSKLEMCFDTTNYQSQFPKDIKFENHVFQTIFLNQSRDSRLWSINEIDTTKIIRKDWWHQLCHSLSHYVLVVPWVWLLQGRQHTRFAGSWTVVNAHEAAIISGIAAAVDLGAAYPSNLREDAFALKSFRLYYLLLYAKWFK